MHWTVLLLILNQNRYKNETSIPVSPMNGLNHVQFELKWNLFKINHVKTYKTPDEHMRRKSIFSQNLLEIDSHNERYEQSLETFKMGINQFSDMSEEEFEDLYKGNDFLNDEILNKNISYVVNTKNGNSKDVNWFTPKIPVKDQGACGSCWTFATTGLLEYDYFYKYYKGGKVLSLSEQELLDCVQKENYGCKGGIPYYALKFVKENGINFEKDYPYKKHKNKCKKRAKKAPHLVQSVQMTPKSEKAILEHLFYSPVIVGVHLNHKVWKNYASGYITAKACTRKKINHAIVILGVVNEGGRKLWFARNSFGKTWGIQGHAELAMNENACEIGKSPGFYVTTI